MPRLNSYIEVGFCSGYGDGDYRVSAAIRDMDRKRFEELKLAALSAIYCAEDMWRQSQAEKMPPGVAAQENPKPNT
jgi:hypothetical protein